MGTVALCWGLCLSLGAGGCAFGPRVLDRSYGPYYESLRRADESCSAIWYTSVITKFPVP